MCKLDGTKCDTCYEITVSTDSGMVFNFTYDECDVDNDVVKSWFFATDFVNVIEIRKVGDTVWSVITKEEWENGR